MPNYIRCRNCGYDMYGPEYLANAIDPFAYSSDSYYPPTALLNLSTRADDQIECPYCHSKGNWSH
ncbi:hypothetical protein PBV87_04265 [Niameybacter massiliensis]|uniref:Uncharacterized protein n=1 Tax=Holtiella tumoricola TaxID=3018743 RepID=A0AA42IZV8_9FIRM|nr:hypothetical protein [Holtiella tumoricola]MDA3730714.1 hypothetical protein [Holtiella tumoricola]